jgi:hypothetical protein
VEAINQSLVDDGLVDKEKIGGSNYFWSFPAKKDRLMELQHQKAIEHIETLKKTITETQAALMDAKRGREETDPDIDDPSTAKDDTAKEEGQEEEGAVPPADPSPALPTRATKLARLAEIAKDKAACEKELEVLRENDPQVLADLEKELHLVHQYVFYSFCYFFGSVIKKCSPSMVAVMYRTTSTVLNFVTKTNKKEEPIAGRTTFSFARTT